MSQSAIFTSRPSLQLRRTGGVARPPARAWQRRVVTPAASAGGGGAPQPAPDRHFASQLSQIAQLERLYRLEPPPPKAGPFQSPSYLHPRYSTPRPYLTMAAASDQQQQEQQDEQQQQVAEVAMLRRIFSSTAEQPRSSAPGALRQQQQPQAASALLQAYRLQFPGEVWSKAASLCTPAEGRQPVAVNVHVGSEGQTGAKLAARGFSVVTIASCAALEAVPSASADLVTCLHGLHLLDAPHRASLLRELHRVLRPGGMLLVAWNDRDLGNVFVNELELAVERHVPAYASADAQHLPAPWAAVLEAGGLFRWSEYWVYDNPLKLPSTADLLGLLSAEPAVQEAVQSLQGQALLAELLALAERQLQAGPAQLAVLTRLYVLEKQ